MFVAVRLDAVQEGVVWRKTRLAIQQVHNKKVHWSLEDHDKELGTIGTQKK